MGAKVRYTGSPHFNVYRLQRYVTKLLIICYVIMEK